MSRQTIFFISFLLLLGFSAWVSAETIIVNYSFEKPTISQRNVPEAWIKAAGVKAFDMVFVPGCESLGYVSEPALPKQPFHVLLPQDQEVVKVEVIYNSKEVLAGKYMLWPEQVEVPLSTDKDPGFTQPSDKIYKSQQPFPSEAYSNFSVQGYRGYKVALGVLHPVQYIGVTGQILYSNSAQVRITTKPEQSPSKEYVGCRNIPSDRIWIENLVDNPSLVKTYHRTVQSSGLSSKDYYPYVIITTQYLAGLSSPNNYQAFLTHKAAHGLPGTIVTREWIQANVTGDYANDIQDKIRTFIKDCYETWDTEWVLLGGDGDDGGAANYTIPPRDFWVQGYSYTDYMPADMYYSCLDGSFNNDGDGQYGEPTDGPGGGEVDLYAEVHVGRACTEDVTELTNFVSKHIWYESLNPNNPWLYKSLMVGELLWSKGSKAPTWGGDYKDEIKAAQCDTWGYTTYGFLSDPDWSVDTLYDRDLNKNSEGKYIEWPPSQIIGYINAGTYSIINHLGHSNTDYCMRIYNSDVDNLTNTTNFFHGYSQGCYDGDLDNASPDCILEHFTCGAHGSFSFVGNARYGWGEFNSTDGSSQYLDRQYFDAFFNEEIKEFGAMNSDSKADNDWKISYKAVRWCIYELNLFGCPATVMAGGVSSLGIIFWDASAYTYANNALVTVQDLDLNTNNSAVDTTTITVTTNAGDNENLLLTETGTATSTFTGTIAIANGSPTPGNGQIDGSDGDLMTATYIDADDGQGGSNIPRTADANLDMLAPVITNVSVDNIGFDRATIIWSTNEDADSTVNYGETTALGETTYDSGMTMIHSVIITDLTANTTYYFEVRSADEVGLEGYDNNGGVYYTFTTNPMYCALIENLDTNPNWPCLLPWAFGQPTGGGGSTGNPDPTSGHTGLNVYGYNLSGDYGYLATEHFLTAGPLDCRFSSGTLLSFWRWLGVGNSSADHAKVLVSNDCVNWTSVWENPSSDLSDAVWTKCTYDISAVADEQGFVYIRWTIGPNDGDGNFCGWNIDDVTVCGTEVPAELFSFSAVSN